MRYRSFLAWSLTAVAMAADPAPTAPAPKSPADALTLQQKASYLFGQQIARTLKQYDLDEATLMRSLSDAKAGKPSLIPDNETQSVLMAWQKEIQAREAKKGEARKATNQVWLAENLKKPGVKVTASGLQYKVIASGKGKQPVATDRVSVNYKGTLLDGTVFDSSAKRGNAATFGVSQVIKGWGEALQLMHEGDNWELYIPAELAYGTQAPPNIGSNQVLVFEVELLKILPPPPAPAPKATPKPAETKATDAKATPKATTPAAPAKK